MIKKSHLCSMHLFRDQCLSVWCKFNGWPLSRLYLSFKSLDETSFCWMYHRHCFNLIDYGYNIALIGLFIQSSVLLISGYLQTKMLQLCLISLDKKNYSGPLQILMRSSCIAFWNYNCCGSECLDSISLSNIWQWFFSCFKWNQNRCLKKPILKLYKSYLKHPGNMSMYGK